MFPLMMPMLIGAGAGLLTNKKKPLEGALMGGALGAAGGAIAPMLGGAAAGGSAIPAMTAAEASTPIVGGYFNGATGAEILAANGGGSAGGGLLGGMTMKGASAYAQPVMQSMQAANLAQGLLSDNPQSVQSHAPDAGNPQGAQTLAQLYQQGTQPSQEDLARMQRKTMWG